VSDCFLDNQDIRIAPALIGSQFVEENCEGNDRGGRRPAPSESFLNGAIHVVE
jgi:hypothetical protein